MLSEVGSFMMPVFPLRADVMRHEVMIMITIEECELLVRLRLVHFPVLLSRTSCSPRVNGL